jgi:hypothetical protein
MLSKTATKWALMALVLMPISTFTAAAKPRKGLLERRKFVLTKIDCPREPVKPVSLDIFLHNHFNPMDPNILQQAQHEMVMKRLANEQPQPWDAATLSELDQALVTSIYLPSKWGVWHALRLGAKITAKMQDSGLTVHELALNRVRQKGPNLTASLWILEHLEKQLSKLPKPSTATPAGAAAAPAIAV